MQQNLASYDTQISSSPATGFWGHVVDIMTDRIGLRIVRLEKRTPRPQNNRRSADRRPCFSYHTYVM